jgi:hypothetical protein
VYDAPRKFREKLFKKLVPIPETPRSHFKSIKISFAVSHQISMRTDLRMILLIIFSCLIANAYGNCAKYFTYIGGNEGILSIPPFQTYDHQLSVVVSYSGQLFSVCIIKMQILHDNFFFIFCTEICWRSRLRKRISGNNQ